jgi:hypothetical protein
VAKGGENDGEEATSVVAGEGEGRPEGGAGDVNGDVLAARLGREELEKPTVGSRVMFNLFSE